MTKRKRSIGELISSFVFFFGGLWLILDVKNLYSEGFVLISILVFLGGAMSIAAAFRFQIQNLFDDKNWNFFQTNDVNLSKIINKFSYFINCQLNLLKFLLKKF